MKLTVYTAPWCRDCHVAKRWLNQNNISYQEINIEETPGAAEEVIQQTGKRAIPPVRDQWHMGAALYSRRRLQIPGNGRAVWSPAVSSFRIIKARRHITTILWC